MKTQTFLHLGLWLLCISSFSCKDGNTTPVSQSATAASHTVNAQAQLLSSNLNSSDKVFVCQSPGAKKYHYNENCRGLNACKHTIASMKKKDAEGIGLGLCGWED